MRKVMRLSVKCIEDSLLRYLQQRCGHPGDMVAVDILEGAADNIQVNYCRRCGAVRPDHNLNDPAHAFRLERAWRMPDPNLWRG